MREHFWILRLPSVHKRVRKERRRELLQSGCSYFDEKTQLVTYELVKVTSMNAKMLIYLNVRMIKFATTSKALILVTVAIQFCGFQKFIYFPEHNIFENHFQGYVFDDGSNQCVDIDECATSSHNCNLNANCINTNGNVPINNFSQIDLSYWFEHYESATRS